MYKMYYVYNMYNINVLMILSPSTIINLETMAVSMGPRYKLICATDFNDKQHKDIYIFVIIHPRCL